MTTSPPTSGTSGLVGNVAARLKNDPVLRNSAAIMGSTIMTALLGYVFWLIVARTAGTEVSGSGAATTSALQATALIASVGAAAAMLEWLPRATSEHAWRRRITAGAVVAVVTAAIGGIVIVALLGPITHTLPELATFTGGGLFLLAAVFFAVGTLVDYVAVSERRGGLLLMRNLVLTGLRTPLLFVPIVIWGTPNQILTSWTIAAGLSLVVALVLFQRKRKGHTLRPAFGTVRADVREMASSLIGQHLITVTAMLAGYLLPIMVVGRLSATDNAYFYVTWMLGSVFFIISPAVSTALFAEGAADPAQMGSLVKRCSLIIGGLLVLPVAVYLLGGGLLLSLFGSDYADHGRMLLILLTLSAIPDAVTNIAVAVLRATNRMGQALWLNSLMLAGCLVASWILLPQLGIVAVGVCWIGSQLLGAIWVLLSWRRIRVVGPAVDASVATPAIPSVTA